MTKTILAVLAHPDDESFGLGGTLALYANKGYDTYLICATRGEVGTVDEEHLTGFTDIAELRTDELRRAAPDLWTIAHRHCPGIPQNTRSWIASGSSSSERETSRGRRDCR